MDFKLRDFSDSIEINGQFKFLQLIASVHMVRMIVTLMQNVSKRVPMITHVFVTLISWIRVLIQASQVPIFPTVYKITGIKITQPMCLD